MFKIIFLCIGLGISIVNAASFDCSKASSHVDKMICSDAEISSLDSKLGRIYKSVLKNIPPKNIDTFQNEGKIWIEKRNNCKNSTCLVDQYLTRISDLKAYHPTKADKTIMLQKTGGEDVYMMIKGNGEQCKINIHIVGSILGTNCLELINSKKIKIFCTKQKKICKTEKEVMDAFNDMYYSQVEKHSEEQRTNNVTSKNTNIIPTDTQQSTTQIDTNQNKQKSQIPNNELKFNYKKKSAGNKKDSIKIKKVIVTGMGINENKAIKNATKAAIQQVVGMYVVSDTMMKNSKLIKDEVLTYSNAFVESFTVLNKNVDEDGLYEIEAEVVVRVDKITNTLSKLNIAIKNVGSDQFKAKALTNFSSVSDFKAMVKKIMIEPIENNNIYEIKLNSFSVMDEEVKERRIKLSEEDLLPFELKFSLTLSKSYIDSIEKLLDESSKSILHEGEQDVRNSISIFQFTGVKKKGNMLILTERLKKRYVLSPRNFKIYQKEIKIFKGNKRRLKVIISILDSQNSIIKKFIYKTRTPQMTTNDRSAIYFNTKHYSSVNLGESYAARMRITDRGDSKYLRGIPTFGEVYRILGDQELLTYLYLNEDEASKISTIKITTSWK